MASSDFNKVFDAWCWYYSQEACRIIKHAIQDEVLLGRKAFP